MTEKHDEFDYPIGWDVTMALLVTIIVVVAPIHAAYNRIKEWLK